MDRKSKIAKQFTSTIDVKEKTVVLRRPTKIIIPVVRRVG